MKIKVSEATGIQLDWMVATIEGLDVYIPAYAEIPWLAIRTTTGIYRCPSYTTDPTQGLPILEKNFIAVFSVETRPFEGQWAAEVYRHQQLTSDEMGDDMYAFYPGSLSYGPTMLVAGLRAYVASKLGDEVEVPEELA